LVGSQEFRLPQIHGTERIMHEPLLKNRMRSGIITAVLACLDCSRPVLAGAEGNEPSSKLDSMTAPKVETQELYARALHRFAQLRDIEESHKKQNQEIELRVLDRLLEDLGALRNTLSARPTAGTTETPDDARRLAMIQTHRPTPVGGLIGSPQPVISITDSAAILSKVEQAESFARNARVFAAASRQREANREILGAEVALKSLGVTSDSTSR
jgi:hypothetical protein